MKFFMSCCIALVTLALGIVAHANAGPILWASTGSTNASGGGRVYTIDPVSLTVTLIGDSGLNKLDGLEFDNAGILYGVSGGSRGPARLFTISTFDASPTFVGTAVGIQGIASLAFDSSGTLFAGGWALGRILTLNPATASILTNVPMVGSGNAFTAGLAFDPAGQLFGSRGNSSGRTEDLVSINTTTGVQTAIGPRTNVISDIWFAPDGTLFGGSPTGLLFTINPATGIKTLVFNTGIRISGLTGQAGVLIVDIDIKPGSDPNGLNPRKKGVVPVAILTTSVADGDSVDFDPFDNTDPIDPTTLRFGPDGASISHAMGHASDVDDDGDLDMVLHFPTQDTGIACGDTEATLTGSTVGGQNIEGTDSVKTSGCK